MLHAAALDPRIRKLVLEEMLVSYDAIVTHRIHRQMFEQIVPAALKFYDLPDLAASLAPRPVWMINAVNPLGQVLSAPEVRAYCLSPRPDSRDARRGFQPACEHCVSTKSFK